MAELEYLLTREDGEILLEALSGMTPLQRKIANTFMAATQGQYAIAMPIVAASLAEVALLAAVRHPEWARAHELAALAREREAAHLPGYVPVERAIASLVDGLPVSFSTAPDYGSCEVEHDG